MFPCNLQRFQARIVDGQGNMKAEAPHSKGVLPSRHTAASVQVILS